MISNLIASIKSNHITKLTSFCWGQNRLRVDVYLTRVLRGIFNLLAGNLCLLETSWVDKVESREDEHQPYCCWLPVWGGWPGGGERGAKLIQLTHQTCQCSFGLWEMMDFVTSTVAICTVAWHPNSQCGVIEYVQWLFTCSVVKPISLVWCKLLVALPLHSNNYTTTFAQEKTNIYFFCTFPPLPIKPVKPCFPKFCTLLGQSLLMFLSPKPDFVAHTFIFQTTEKLWQWGDFFFFTHYALFILFYTACRCCDQMTYK